MPFAKKHSGMFGSARCPTCYLPIENKIAWTGEAMHNMLGDCNCHRDDHEMGNEIGHVITDDDISKFPSWCMLADSSDNGGKNNSVAFSNFCLAGADNAFEMDVISCDECRLTMDDSEADSMLVV